MTNKITITLKTRVEIKQELEKHAKRLDRSRNWIYNKALEEWLEHNRNLLKQEAA